MTFDVQRYRQFIADKSGETRIAGFEAQTSNRGLFVHQEKTVDFVCSIGRGAAFLDTGLGKSRVEAVCADEFRRASNKPSLILTPLAVAQQMKRECEACGIEAKVIRDQSQASSGVNIANYERLDNLDVSKFGGIILDESSILKSFSGPTKQRLVDAFRETKYRLAATATPSPNDYMELGSHSEFLSYLGSMEMLCRWFINDTSMASQKWRLKGHAQSDFWAWIASWARAASLPSDLGGCDDGYILPPLKYHTHVVSVDRMKNADEGMLFRIPDNSATSIHKEKRLTLDDRVRRSADIANHASGPVIVWCETNDESKALAKAIPDSIEVHGSMTLDQKETALNAFTFGERRVIVTKPKLAGFGLNWQHAKTVIFSSLSHSYEQHYQAVRRSWRFGQDSEVNAHIVLAETEASIWSNIQRKAQDHDRMKKAMVAAMTGAQRTANRKIYEQSSTVKLPTFMEA